MRIMTLKANLSLSQATRSLGGAARQLRHGQLVKVMPFYIPFRLFRVRMENGKQHSQRLIALDAVGGQLDLYDFENGSAEADRQEVETTDFASIRLAEDAAAALLTEKLKRQVYLQGFFKVRDLKITHDWVEMIYLPYYVGLYKRGERVMIEALDGLRARYEGAKVRDIITEWFQTSR